MLDYRPLARRGLGPGIQRSSVPLYDVLGESSASVSEDTQSAPEEIVAEVEETPVAVLEPNPAPAPEAPEAAGPEIAEASLPQETDYLAQAEPEPVVEEPPFPEMVLPETVYVDWFTERNPEPDPPADPLPDPLPDPEVQFVEQSDSAKNGAHACPVCGRRNGKPRFSSVGRRLMSRCLRCDLLTIANPLGEQNPEDHAEHLRCSVRTFWFHVREYLGESGNRAPVGYSGPPEYLEPIARAARNRSTVIGLEDLENYSRPGQCPAILLFHALESAPDPEGLLTRCHRMLAPEGRLFVAASDAKSLQCILRASGWNGLRLQDQMFCYSAATLDRLLRAAGFRVERSVRSGLEVLGHNFEIATGAPVDEGKGFTGFVRKITWQASALRSFRSVLFIEAAPTAPPRLNVSTRPIANPKKKRAARVRFESGSLASRNRDLVRGPARS